MPDYRQELEDLLPVSGRQNDLSQELGADYLANLDKTFQRQEQGQIDQLLQQQEARGFLRSGDTSKQLIEQYLGPSIERRRSALLPVAMQGAQQGKEERLGALDFERKRQFASEDYQRQIDFLARQHQVQKELLELRQSLENSGGGFSWEGLAGTALGAAAGSFGGYAGASAGAGLGGRIGSMFGKSKTPGNAVNDDPYAGWG